MRVTRGGGLSEANGLREIGVVLWRVVDMCLDLDCLGGGRGEGNR